MAFTDGCSCHVWAIDGWVNDQLSATVNTEYAEAGTAIAMGQVPVATTLSAKVAYLLMTCRVSPAVAQAGTLYGGFQAVGDGSPEHMWFEYGGYVYDTMPGSPLRRVRIGWFDFSTRRFPPSEAQAFASDMVGSARFSLTESQYRLIAGPGVAWQSMQMGGRTIEYYTP